MIQRILVGLIDQRLLQRDSDAKAIADGFSLYTPKRGNVFL